MSNEMNYVEQDTQEYYDQMNTTYNSFWDYRGSLHWGLFINGGESLESAFDNLTKRYVETLDPASPLLDIGSGNGYVDLELVDKYGFTVTGIDLSPERVKYAQQLKKKYSQKAQGQVRFLQGSATKLPFVDNEYGQLMSQSTFYHVHDKERLLSEVSRVTDHQGVLLFDDLFKPKNNISENARVNVYERLLFDTPFNFDTYQEALRQNSFEVVLAEDFTEHLYRTYFLLKKRLEEINIPEGKKLMAQYEGTLKAIDDKEVGWGLFECKKR